MVTDFSVLLRVENPCFRLAHELDCHWPKQAEFASTLAYKPMALLQAAALRSHADIGAAAGAREC